MKRDVARKKLINMLVALALSFLFLLPGQIQAQGMTGYIIMFPSVGLGARPDLTSHAVQSGG